MIPLDDAYDWYKKTKKTLLVFGRIGEKHWNDLPWDGVLGRDEKLKSLEAHVIVKDSNFCLEHLDDLAVMLLFSAFESVVRNQVVAMLEAVITAEQMKSRESFLIDILHDARRENKRARIVQLIRFFKGRDAALLEQVNQVRRYRNWVIHGRRTDRPPAVDPAMAYGRLKRFLASFPEAAL
jgi:hypothetical protein